MYEFLIVWQAYAMILLPAMINGIIYCLTLPSLQPLNLNSGSFITKLVWCVSPLFFC